MKSRRSWKKFLAVSLCAFCLQAPAAVLSDPVPVMAEAKSGIQKEKGKIYFYENGQRVRNTWKNVKEVKKGKTVVSRYYFGANGAAYAGKKVFGVNVPAVKKINGKVYGFGTEGRMLKGIYVVNGKALVQSFLAFSLDCHCGIVSLLRLWNFLVLVDPASKTDLFLCFSNLDDLRNSFCDPGSDQNLVFLSSRETFETFCIGDSFLF